MIESQARISSAREVADELRRRSCFVMVSHVKPDGDTLGAGFALGLALKRLGKRVLYFAEDAIPRNLRFLPEAQYASRQLPSDLPADTLFVFCDMSDWRRAGDGLPALTRENMLDIDHHLGNALFGKFNFVLETECSTGSVVMHLLRELGVPLDASIATCILTTIMTDTGGFMHSNTTADALDLSAQLIRLGADKEKITEEVFLRKRVAATKLLGRIIDEMTLKHGGSYCYSYVDDAMLAQTGADGEDTEDFVNVLLGQEGVNVAALFKAIDGELRVSLRSNGGVNVQAAAARLGGGGHFRASGLTFKGTLPNAFESVEQALIAEGL
ncbi:MAG: bifunctional oligoribonuclease/PAP phosphatase NrnA [Candidatus Eremiobacteraeota bacterium]|nr:bifunctional oligoribonuclease/PAP phosphatase NrnA [Candidatus Eremiobacteraeota bacterium]MBV9056431.1 bifunctional oligoribonuclease/PAP phosphatase NrnA [Candidatus Eremiobacteraeota bacterium]MBV9698582.1 bifunctional oligoribonuclease/PAP phosphatase NrnA [Candidatus Eremiobacteraeota bacterium]